MTVSAFLGSHRVFHGRFAHGGVFEVALAHLDVVEEGAFEVCSSKVAVHELGGGDVAVGKVGHGEVAACDE